MRIGLSGLIELSCIFSINSSTRLIATLTDSNSISSSNLKDISQKNISSTDYLKWKGTLWNNAFLVNSDTIQEKKYKVWYSWYGHISDQISDDVATAIAVYSRQCRPATFIFKYRIAKFVKLHLVGPCLLWPISLYKRLRPWFGTKLEIRPEVLLRREQVQMFARWSNKGNNKRIV
jgi:hypothetical protein